MLVNALRAHLAEFGVVAPQDLRHVERLVAAIEENRVGLPELARAILRLIVAQLNDTQAKVRQIEAKLAQRHRNSRLSKLLATIPGVGIMGASAIAATVCDPSLFRSGREFAAWLGMTPRQNSSGGKERLGRTSKRGDKYIRGLLVAGAVAVLRHARNRATKDAEWVRALLARRPAKVVAVALANRTARIVWAAVPGIPGDTRIIAHASQKLRDEVLKLFCAQVILEPFRAAQPNDAMHRLRTRNVGMCAC